MTGSRLEAFRRAVEDLGDASADELLRHIRQTYGVTIAPPMVPILRACLRDLENLARVREAAALRQVEAAPPAD
jgi:hypothetical protein